MSNAPIELDQTEFGKAKIAEKLRSLEKVPESIAKWVRVQIADLYNTNLGIAYVPESLQDDIPVYRAVNKRKLGKLSKEGRNYWYIGTANREPAIETVNDFKNRNSILITSTIGDLKEAGEVTIHQNGLVLRIENLKDNEPYKIVDEEEYKKKKY